MATFLWLTVWTANRRGFWGVGRLNVNFHIRSVWNYTASLYAFFILQRWALKKPCEIFESPNGLECTKIFCIIQYWFRESVPSIMMQKIWDLFCYANWIRVAICLNVSTLQFVSASYNKIAELKRRITLFQIIFQKQRESYIEKTLAWIRTKFVACIFQIMFLDLRENTSFM